MNKPGHPKHDELNQSETKDLRGLTDLQAAEDFLFLQVWFNRNVKALYSNAKGEILICADGTRPIESGELPPSPGGCRQQGLITARDAVRRYGLDSFGPWSDFEWGMINGKLSAIRWMLGDDWDNLDT